MTHRIIAGAVYSLGLVRTDRYTGTSIRPNGLEPGRLRKLNTYIIFRKLRPSKMSVSANEAGMEYFFFPPKHHDGFCM